MNRAAFLAGSNFCTTSGLLTATGAETVYDTTATINFCEDGVAFSKTAITDGVMPLLDTNGVLFETLAASQGCALLFLLDAAGLVSVMQGELEVIDDSGTFEQAPEFPEAPEGNTAFAYMILENDSTGSTFTIGTSNWDATGATNSIKNLFVLPSRPQVS